MDWRIKLLFLVFLIIPAVGAWEYAKAYNRIDSQQLSLAELYAMPSTQKKQCELREFQVAREPIQTRRYEYVVVESPEPSLATGSSVPVDDAQLVGASKLEGEPKQVSAKVIFRRKTLMDGTLADRIATGTVNGVAFARSSISQKEAVDLGLGVDPSGLESYPIVDIDRDIHKQTLSNIFWATIYLSSGGFLLLCYIASRISANQMHSSARRDHVRGQVALQMAIARQELSRF